MQAPIAHRVPRDEPDHEHVRHTARNAIGVMNGSADFYGTIVRNCMASDGHKSLN